MSKHIEMMNVADLTPYVNNARTHSDAQIMQIASSILEFGFTNPILIDGDKGIIAGHGRLLAAKKLGMSEIPTAMLDYLSPEQKRAYIIADNKLAELAGWDEKLLAQELADLRDMDVDLDIIGFNEQELEVLLATLDEDNTTEEAIPDPEENPVSKLGDIWLLGNHKLMCSDATDKVNLDLLLGEELSDMTFTDPPYNVDYAKKTKFLAKAGKGKARSDIINDNIGNNFADFLSKVCSNIIAFNKGACYICMSCKELDVLKRVFIDAGGKVSTFIIWVKNSFNLGMSDYQRQYEPILYGYTSGKDYYWCGRKDQSDIWNYPKPQKSELHPTMKPIELCQRAIINSSKTRDIVLDLFGGSGSTLIACERTSRQCRMMELDPRYVDVIIKRWQEYTGGEAVRKDDKEIFNNLIDGE